MFTRAKPFAEALSLINGKTPITSELGSAGWAMLPRALRQRAFWSATVNDAHFIGDLHDALKDFLAGARETIVKDDGTTVTKLKVGGRADFVNQMRASGLARGFAPADEDKGTIKDLTSEKRLNLIFDVNSQAAYGYGDWLQGMSPAVLNAYPAWEFIREEDRKVPRMIHVEHTGTIRLKTDVNFWVAMNNPRIGGFSVPWGPWGFRSGMATRDVSRRDAESRGLIKKGEYLKPIDRDFNQSLEAGVTNLAPVAQEWLKEQFGNQIEIVDGRARWIAPARPEPKPPVKPVKPNKAEKPAKPPVREKPADPALPSETPRDRAKRLVDEAWKKAGFDRHVPNSEKFTTEAVREFRQLLQTKAPANAAELITGIQRATPELTTIIHEATQQFLGYFPTELINTLPKLRFVIDSPTVDYGGRYDFNGLVRVRAGQTPEYTRRVIMHELMHWVHIEGPRWYQEVIAEHFTDRTRGERIIPIPGYEYMRPRPMYLPDKWYDGYAGRVYGSTPDHFGFRYIGVEIPTRYFETFADDLAVQAAMFRSPTFAETLKVVLQILFA